LIDLDERWLAVNERFCKTLNLSAEYVLNRHVDELLTERVSNEDMESLKLWRQAFYAVGVTTPQIFWLQRENQGKIPYEIRRTPIFDDDGNVRGLAAVARELTDRYEAKTHQQLLTQIFEHNIGGMLMIDADRNIVTSNQVFANFLGYSLQEIQGVHLRQFISRQHHDEALLDSIIRRLHAKIIFSGEIWLLCKDGSAKPFDCRVVPLVNEQQTDSWLLFVNDLSAHKATEAHIETLTNKDVLTGLPNRHGFIHELKKRLRRSGEHALLLLDLNQFSRINDAYGHLVGDQLLRHIGKRIRRLLREQDIVGRLGDNQFAVLAAHVDAQNVQNIINKLIAAISKPVLAGEQSISCTACIGISLAPQDGQTAELLLQNADTAMHHAHDIGPNTYRFFSFEMNARLVTRLNRETDLRKALEQQEFVLHYQPQVDVSEGRIIGCEALLRWNHPTLGLIPPLDFIPLAEENGQILPIGKWVLEEACRQNKAWQDQDLPPITMAVNLSAVQFLDEQIGDHITHALESSGLAPRWLELEITESVLMHDPEQVVTTLEQLKNLGVRLSIDDFGTGYSSLAYLKRFPVDKIKIDQSFIRDVCASNDDAAIVRMVLGMARELRLHAIAEGVESEDQLHFLEAWQCHEYQGFLYSRPVPGAEFETFLRKHPAT
jgi:diguanylate cyclase (GGDEF)-like protein/PAS domain S-box-containing protein